MQRRVAFGWDRYHYDYGVAQVGDPRSAVSIRCELRGPFRPPLPATFPECRFRLGIDLNPVDVRNPTERRWFEALIWPDHPARRRLAAAAIEELLRDPPALVKGDAVDVLGEQLECVPPDTSLGGVQQRRTLSGRGGRPAGDCAGAHRVLVSSAAPLAALRKSGGAASRDRRVAASWKQELANIDGHGRWLEWLAGEELVIVTKERSWLSFARRSVQFWAGVGLIGFGAIFSVVQVAILAQEQQYGREGQLVDGVVVSKTHQARHAQRVRAAAAPSSRVAYRFTVGGQTYNGDESVASGEWDQLTRAEAGADSIRRVESREEPDRRPHVGGVVVRVRRRRGHRGAHRSGAPGEVDRLLQRRKRISGRTALPLRPTVSSVEETNVEINRRTMWVACYQYRDHTGQAREGQSHYMSAARRTPGRRETACRSGTIATSRN